MQYTDHSKRLILFSGVFYCGEEGEKILGEIAEDDVILPAPRPPGAGPLSPFSPPFPPPPSPPAGYPPNHLPRAFPPLPVAPAIRAPPPPAPPAFCPPLRHVLPGEMPAHRQSKMPGKSGCKGPCALFPRNGGKGCPP